ncbi:hypothetical protein VTO73DRAFT_6247 [Trametes versicolor]
MALDLNASIGSLFIGYTLSLWLYGVTLSQIGLFFHNSSRESSRHQRVIVWLLFVLENAQTIALSEGLWLYVVNYHANPTRLARPPRAFGVLVYTTSLNNLLVRSVYAYRMHQLGVSIVLPTIVVILSILVSTLACIYGTQGVTMVTWGSRKALAWTFYAGYSCELAADLIITATMVIMFAQKNVGMRSSDRFTQTLLVYFLNSGLLVMMCVIGSTVAYIKLPNSFAFLGFYLVLGKLYANSLLGSFNARDVIFPHANWEKETTNSAPLLTSVVVLDEPDDMVTTVVAEAEDVSKRMNGSIGSEDTHVEEGQGKRHSKEDGEVQIVQRVVSRRTDEGQIS